MQIMPSNIHADAAPPAAFKRRTRQKNTRSYFFLIDFLRGLGSLCGVESP
jgi:hypothetical protein